MGSVRLTTRLRCYALCCLLGGGSMVLGFFLPLDTTSPIDMYTDYPSPVRTDRGSDVFAFPFAQVDALGIILGFMLPLLGFCFALLLCFSGTIGLFRRNRRPWVLVGLSTYLVVGYASALLFCFACNLQGGWYLSMAGALVGGIGSIGLALANKER